MSALYRLSRSSFRRLSPISVSYLSVVHPRSYPNHRNPIHNHNFELCNQYFSLGKTYIVSQNALFSTSTDVVQGSNHGSGGNDGNDKNLKDSGKTWIDLHLPQGIRPYAKLARLDRPIGTWLLAWPCMWSITLAAEPGNLPDVKMLALFGCGSLLLRGAGCTINDLLDQDIDVKVERTKLRPIASGLLTPFQGISFLGVQLFLGLGILLQLNNYRDVGTEKGEEKIGGGIGGTSIAVMEVVWERQSGGFDVKGVWGTAAGVDQVVPGGIRASGLVGSMSGRWWLTEGIENGTIIWKPQAYLGLTFNWGALLGWSAVRGSLDPLVILPLYASGVCWTLVYDTIYAHQDKEDDLKVGVKSTALRFGDSTKEWLSGFGLACITGLAVSGFNADLGWPYYICLGGASGQLAWQIYTVDLSNRADCNRKFVSNKWFGALLFSGILFGRLAS
ncbi:hypothetical protein KSS87_022086 [Heliosperma pusillum]|nr:hypothetical protein KSS87_022086 [Heliosperma pusillum]